MPPLKCCVVGMWGEEGRNLNKGELPAGKNKLVQAWLEIHKEELMADWELASNGTNVFQIEPLK